MGLLIEGRWHDQWYDTKRHGGEFVRESAKLRDWVTADGGPGPDGQTGLPAETGRYHLYVSLACPWAHRTLIMRRLKGLTSSIDVSVTSPLMLDQAGAIIATRDRVATRSTVSNSIINSIP